MSEVKTGTLELGYEYRFGLLSTDRIYNGSGDSSCPPVTIGEQIYVRIEDIGTQGDGIAKVDSGYIVFVPGTDIGERLTVQVGNVNKNFAFAGPIEE